MLARSRSSWCRGSPTMAERFRRAHASGLPVCRSLDLCWRAAGDALGPAAALPRAARGLQPRRRPRRPPGARARARRLRLLPAGAVLEPDLLRRRRRAAPRSAMQPAPGRPYAFVLHGLWPQYERGWPQDCRSSDRGYVPRPGGRAACSTSCRASGWCSTSTASTAPARASASTAISISRAGCTTRSRSRPASSASPTRARRSAPTS